MISDSDIEHNLLKLALHILHADINFRVMPDVSRAVADLTDRSVPLPDYIIVDTESEFMNSAATQLLLAASGHRKTTKIILYGPPAQAVDMERLLDSGAQSYILKSYSFSVFCLDLEEALTS